MIVQKFEVSKISIHSRRFLSKHLKNLTDHKLLNVSVYALSSMFLFICMYMNDLLSII